MASLASPRKLLAHPLGLQPDGLGIPSHPIAPRPLSWQNHADQFALFGWSKVS